MSYLYARLMKLFTTLSAAALLFGSLLNAQTPSDRITVRFATPVMIGETKIPAGECDIQVMHSASDSIVLVVRPEGGSAVSVLASHLSDSTTEVNGDASIVLDRRGDTYRLNRILFSDHTGYQVQPAE